MESQTDNTSDATDADILMHQMDLMSSLDDEHTQTSQGNVAVSQFLKSEAENPWGEGTSYTYERDCALWLNIAAGEYKVLGKPIVVHEQEHEGNHDTGLTVWDGAVILGKFLELNLTPNAMHGLNVVELGSGSGLCGITASVLGASNVVLTDLPYCLSNLNNSIQLNKSHCHGNVVAQVLDWFQPVNFSQYPSLAGNTFLIIAADVVWLEDLVTPLCNTLDAMLSVQAKNSNNATRSCACHVGKSCRIVHQGQGVSDQGTSMDIDTYDDMGLGEEFSRQHTTPLSSKDFERESAWLLESGRGGVAYVSYTFRFDAVHRLLMAEFDQRFCWTEIPHEQVPWVGSDCHFDDSPQVHVYRLQLKCSENV